MNSFKVTVNHFVEMKKKQPVRELQVSLSEF